MAINIKARNEGKRSIRKKILIVCEGAKTEPLYFKGFRVAKDICDIRGIGANTLSLVKTAENLRDKGEYSETWCVFDRDSFSKVSVNNALSYAENVGIKCAFSNESFELWYVLHFCYLDTLISRRDYCKKLDELIGIKYKKNDPDIFKLLLPKQSDAIRYAKKLEKTFCTPSVSLCDAAPITTVYRLVERLNLLEKKQIF